MMVDIYLNFFSSIPTPGHDHKVKVIDLEILFKFYVKVFKVSYYPLAQQSCGGDIGSVPYVCM